MKAQSPKRVLLITWNYPPKVGGIETLLSQLVSSLRSYGEVYVIGPHADNDSVSADSKWISRPKNDGFIWFVLYAFLAGIRLLKAKKCNLIFAGSGLVTPIVYVLGRLFRLPAIVHIHGLDLIYPHPLYQWMIRKFLPRCDYVFANSSASKEEALQLDVFPEQIGVVNPGLDFSEFEKSPNLAEITERYDLKNRQILLSVGRLAKRKGVLEFVKYALPEIIKQEPETLFLIVGDNPTDSLDHKEDIKGQIDTAVKRLALEDHVRLLGRVSRDDLINIYHSCDVFVLPAIQIPGDMEGFGIVMTEANAAGKPVVSTKLGGITDAVVDGKSGILVEPGKWDEISDAILTLLADESLQQKMGQFGRERAKKELDWQIISAKYAEIVFCYSDTEFMK